jgi:pimeloyl-ACP methyl ester carboxylesterase
MEKFFGWVNSHSLVLFSGLTILGVLLAPVLLQDFLIIPGLLHGKGASNIPPSGSQFFVKSTNEVLINVWVDGNGPPIMICHGNNDSVWTFWERQRLFVELGYTVYVFDYRGVGRSTGWPSERGLLDDSDAVLREVARRHKIHPSTIPLVGISLGTGPVLYLASLWSTKYVLLFSPYLSLPAVVEEKAIFARYVPFLHYKFDNESSLAARLGQVTIPMRVLILHSTNDKLIPYWHGKRLSEQVRPPHTIDIKYHETAAHHPTVEEMWVEASEWLSSVRQEL